MDMSKDEMLSARPYGAVPVRPSSMQREPGEGGSKFWRHTFAGQLLAAEISIGEGLCQSDYMVAVERADRLLAALGRTK